MFSNGGITYLKNARLLYARTCDMLLLSPLSPLLPSTPSIVLSIEKRDINLYFFETILPNLLSTNMTKV